MEPSSNSADIGRDTLRRFDRGAVSPQTENRVVQALAASSAVQRRLDELAWLPTPTPRHEPMEGSNLAGDPSAPCVGRDREAASTVKSIATVAQSISARSDAATLHNDELSNALPQDSDYEFVSELGRGGMGVVFEVIYKGLGTPRREAVKILHPSLTLQSSLRRRFDRELQSLVHMSDHPCVTTAYRRVDLGKSLGYAMELVPGDNLHDLIGRRGVMPVSLACQIVADVASTLSLAHQRGLVHRDIKPCNLMIYPSGHRWLTKVLDFGLAKLVRGPTTETLTHAGAVLGTPQFMAPEQIRDPSGADIRSDLYSLGCTLFFLLTGKPLFEGTYDQILLGHVQPARPSITDHRTDVPHIVAAMLNRLIHHDPDQRFDNPAELELELASILDSEDRQGSQAFAAPIARESFVPGNASPPATIDTTNESFSDVETVERDHVPTDARSSLDPAPQSSRQTRSSRQTTSRFGWLAAAGMFLAVAAVAMAGTHARWLWHQPTPSRSIADVASLTAEPSVRLDGTIRRPTDAVTNPKSVPPLDGDSRDAYVVWGSPWHIDNGHLVQSAGWGEQWLVFGDTQWTDYVFQFEYLHRPGHGCLSTLVACDDDGTTLSCGVGWLGGRKVLELSEPDDRFQPIRESEPFRLEATDQWRTVTTRLEAGKLSFWVNGQSVWLDEPVPRTNGRVGIRTYSKSADRELRVRNIRVESTDGELLWEGLPELPMDLFAGGAHSVTQLRSARVHTDGGRWKSLLGAPTDSSDATVGQGFQPLPAGWSFEGPANTWSFQDQKLISAGYSSWSDFRNDLPVQLKTESAFEDFLLHARVSLDADADNGIIFRRSGEACVEVNLQSRELGNLILWGERRWTFRKGFRMSRRLDDVDVRQPFDIYIQCEKANITVWVNDRWVAYAHLPDSRNRSPIELWPCPEPGSRTVFHTLEWMPVIDPTTFRDRSGI